jgi:hypothetical protein
VASEAQPEFQLLRKDGQMDKPMEDKHAPEPNVGSARCQQAYVLRMWSADQYWQASLQDVKTSQRIGFASLEELFAYLMDSAEKQCDRTAKPNETGG